MAKEKETQLTVPDVPAYLQNISATLDDNFGSDDVTLPRVSLLQGMSPECADIPEANPGMFWHTGLDKPVDPLRFVVCTRNKNVLLLAPMDDGQGVLAYSSDAVTWNTTGSWKVCIDKRNQRYVNWDINTLSVEKSGLLRWGTVDPENPASGPAATMFYNYLVLFPDYLEWGPAMISLARSAIKKAKRGLNDKILMQAGAGRPMQSLVFLASPVQERSEFGTFWNWQFKADGFASEEVYLKAKEIESMLPTVASVTEEPVLDEEETGYEF